MKVFVSVGERSCSNYIYEIFKGVEGIEFTGITDERLEGIGFKSVARIEDLSVVGIVEALPKIPKVYRLWKRIEEILPQMDALILCDAPAFNLPLLKRARKLVRKIIYFVSPQVWAWKEGRARVISELVDHLIVILPFEVDFYENYRREGFKVHFVGHPLVDMAKPSLSREEVLSLVGSDSYLALLPGSRWSEIKRHTPYLKTFLECLKPDIPVVIPTFQSFSQYLRKEFEGYSVRVFTSEELQKPSYNTMAYSEFAAVASGTAELEASLLGVPHVVFYRVSPITYLLGKLLVKVKYVALTNLILQRQVVPELVQKSPTELCRVVRRYLEEPALREEMKENFIQLKKALGSEGTLQRLRALFLQLLYE